MMKGSNQKSSVSPLGRGAAEIKAPDVAVHQPPDHEDDQDQSEYAADPNRPALTVIAAAVIPKPAPEENHEEQDDQN